jgi:hypothetical protein
MPRTFFVDLGRLVAHQDGVAVALAHLGAVQARQAQHLGVQRLRLDRMLLAAAAQVAQQQFGVVGGPAGCRWRRPCDQAFALGQRFGTAGLAEGLALLVVVALVVLGQLGQRRGNAGLEAACMRPYRWLKRRATSRVSSTCEDWSSPTGT